MGCGGSTGSDDKLMMKKTNLEGIDEFFDDVQGFIEEINEVQDPIDDAEAALLEACYLDKTPDANVHHAIVGTVFSVAGQSNGSDLENMVTITVDDPFIDINKRGASADTVNAIEKINDYIKSLVEAKDKIEPFMQKATDFAEKAPELPDKVQGEISNAGGLGAMDKLRAVRFTAGNVRNTVKLPNLVNSFKDTILGALENVKEASKELNQKKGKIMNIRKN